MKIKFCWGTPGWGWAMYGVILGVSKVFIGLSFKRPQVGQSNQSLLTFQTEETPSVEVGGIYKEYYYERWQRPGLVCPCSGRFFSKQARRP